MKIEEDKVGRNVVKKEPVILRPPEMNEIKFKDHINNINNLKKLNEFKERDSKKTNLKDYERKDK